MQIQTTPVQSYTSPNPPCTNCNKSKVILDSKNFQYLCLYCHSIQKNQFIESDQQVIYDDEKNEGINKFDLYRGFQSSNHPVIGSLDELSDSVSQFVDPQEKEQQKRKKRVLKAEEEIKKILRKLPTNQINEALRLFSKILNRVKSEKKNPQMLFTEREISLYSASAVYVLFQEICFSPKEIIAKKISNKFPHVDFKNIQEFSRKFSSQNSLLFEKTNNFLGQSESNKASETSIYIKTAQNVALQMNLPQEIYNNIPQVWEKIKGNGLFAGHSQQVLACGIIYATSKVLNLKVGLNIKAVSQNAGLKNDRSVKKYIKEYLSDSQISGLELE